MIIETTNNEVLFNSDDYDMPDFWPFKLFKAVFGDNHSYTEANIAGIYEAINELSDREKVVILLRFKDGLTIVKTADKLGITYYQVRQIEAKGLRLLRDPKLSNKMLVVSRASYEKLEAENKKLLSKLIQYGCDNEFIYSIPIDNLDFSCRAYNCLSRAGIKTVDDLAVRTAWDIINIRNLGIKAFEEVIFKLKSLGITLEYTDDVMRERKIATIGSTGPNPCKK